MNHLQRSQHAALVDLHSKIEGALAKVKDSTKEAAEQALSHFRSPHSESIVPFTGYYSMSAANGAFLSIDTTETYYKLTQKITISTSSVTVSVSMDGVSSKTYPLDSTTTFDGHTLTIPNVLTITLTREYDQGRLVRFSGVVNKVNVTGYTLFNPIALSTFNGQYATPAAPAKKILSINDSATIPFNSSVSFDSGSGLTQLKLYTFVPLMFVLTFNDPVSKASYLIMMGTAGAKGLACFIEQGAGGEYAFTIPTA